MTESLLEALSVIREVIINVGTKRTVTKKPMNKTFIVAEFRMKLPVFFDISCNVSCLFIVPS